MALSIPESLAHEENCYLTTTGRVSGQPHTIEIWFAIAGTTLYMLSGYRADAHWVKNALQQPKVRIKIGGKQFEASARHVRDQNEDAVARRLLFEKYMKSRDDDLTDWRESTLPMAFDLL